MTTDTINPDALERIRRITAADATGNYAADCARGRDLADELIVDLRATGFPGTLAHVTRDLVERGQFDAVHIGFFGRVGELAAG